jgi:hypothetical protein
MPTNTAGSTARRDPRNVSNTMVGIANFSDSTLGVQFGVLPMGARITDVIVEIITAFNAATTNILTVGTNSTAFNNVVAGGDVPPGAVGATRVDRGIGGSIMRAGPDAAIFIKFAQTGTAATTGKAEVTIVFEGGWTN